MRARGAWKAAAGHVKPRLLKGRGPRLLADGSVPEKVIQAAILAWLRQVPNVIHWRQNSGVVFAGKRRVLLGDSGLPDIIVIVAPSGLVLGLEVKSAHGSLRKAQKEFRARLEAVGGLYRVVRSLTEARNAVSEALGESRSRATRQSNCVWREGSQGGQAQPIADC